MSVISILVCPGSKEDTGCFYLFIEFMCIFRDVYSVGLLGASGTREARLAGDFSLFENRVDQKSFRKYTLVGELKLRTSFVDIQI